jgi:hypothetical protein
VGEVVGADRRLRAAAANPAPWGVCSRRPSTAVVPLHGVPPRDPGTRSGLPLASYPIPHTGRIPFVSYRMMCRHLCPPGISRGPSVRQPTNAAQPATANTLCQSSGTSPHPHRCSLGISRRCSQPAISPHHCARADLAHLCLRHRPPTTDAARSVLPAGLQLAIRAYQHVCPHARNPRNKHARPARRARGDTSHRLYCRSGALARAGQHRLLRCALALPIASRFHPAREFRTQNPEPIEL